MMKKYFFKKNKEKNTQGFALLFTIVVVSLILTISIGISDITYKQSILSGLVTDSQTAFDQADNALECGLYYAPNILSGPQPSQVQCGPNITLQYNSAKNIYVSIDTTNSSPCYYFSINTQGVTTTIEGHGFNICSTTNPRQVERVMKVMY